MHVLSTTIEKSLISICKNKVEEIPPIWLMRQAGRYLPEYLQVRQKAGSFLSLCFSPALAEEVTLQPIRRFGFDAAILFSDILVIPLALGMNLTFAEGEGPVLTPLANPDAVEKLIWNPERLSAVYEVLDRLKNSLPESVTRIGFSGAPWTLACYMLEGRSVPDFPTAKKFLYQQPEGFLRLLNFLVEVVSEHLIAQAKAGAEVLKIFDSWAGIVPGSMVDKIIFDTHQQIISKVRLRTDVPIISFPRGIGSNYQRYCMKIAANIIAMDTQISMSEAASWAVPLQGNLDPLLLCLGNINQIESEVFRIKEACYGKPFVFNLGHGILPKTPIENVSALVKAVRAAEREKI
jgi:uroporphyrinogen decarboxylase